MEETRKELLLEIGTEEIPARFVDGLAKNLARGITSRLDDLGLGHTEPVAYHTPRRLVVQLAGVDGRQPDKVVEHLGPAKAVALDKDGNPTKAALGFARGKKVEFDRLTYKETPKGERLCFVEEVQGKPAMELLPTVLAESIGTLPIPKAMRWEVSSGPFVRPVHWIVALFDGAVVPVEYADVQAGTASRGHRFASPESFDVTSFQGLADGLAERRVVLDPAAREATIREGIASLEASSGFVVGMDETLLHEVARLVEAPVVLMGRYSEEFLEMPSEIPVTAMKSHQRYFPMYTEDGGLAPAFIIVSNSPQGDAAMITRGNERVLEARLSDGRFFFQVDRKRSLESFNENLEQRIFLQQLGTMRAKVDRVESLSRWLSEKLCPDAADHAARGAHLAKADLATEVVGEFPDLQGITGRHYATLDGEPAEVARVVAHHYRPRFAGDELPEGDAASIVAIADKIDSIVGCFGIGFVPTGNQDPYALRRQALGIVNIARGRGYLFSLTELLTAAADLYGDKLTVPRDELTASIIDFFHARLKSLLGDSATGDVIQAVLGVTRDSLLDVFDKVALVTELKEDPTFAELVTAFKRPMNITKKLDELGDYSGDTMTDDAERALFEAFSEVKAAYLDDMAARRFGDALGRIRALKPAIDRFFDEVFVMVDDEAVRTNRLNFLGDIASTFGSFADFTSIQL